MLHDESTAKPRIPTLTQANYHAWLSAVKDELYAIEADDLLAKAALNGNGTEQEGNCTDEDVIPENRRKAYIMIKRSISPEIKSKLEDINAGEVETLLRRVRLSFYKPSPHLVELLHDKISTLTVANFTNMDAYILEFKQTASLLSNCGGKVDDSILKMWLLKGLPSDYTMVKFHVQTNPANISLADTYLAIASFASTDPRLTGSTHPAHKAGRRDRASAASEPPATKSEELCRTFARSGKCPYGDSCKWKHVTKPAGGNATPNNAPRPAASEPPSGSGCDHCKKHNFARWQNHSTAKCQRKTYVCTTCNTKGHHSTAFCPKTKNKAAAANELDSEYDAADIGNRNVALTALVPNAAIAAATAIGILPSSIKLLIDGGANCAIFTSTAGMSNVRHASIDIKVGGGSVHCDLIGDFSGTIVDHSCPSGEARSISIEAARICPDFGQNIVPESRFTNKDFIITKKQNKCTIVRGPTAITAQRGADQLFYLTVVPTTTTAVPPCPPNVSQDSAVLNARGPAAPPMSPLDADHDAAACNAFDMCCFVDSTSAEACPCCGEIDRVYIARTYDEYGNILQLKHYRYGHRHLGDVAQLEGVTLPPKPFFCRACVEGKSTRLSLNKRRVEPLYIAPRPAYAWHTDTAGPFSTRTPEGHNQMRLLIDGYSHYRKIEMVSSTADFHVAWDQHITSVETELGRTSIVAQLISDSAKYYDSDALDAINQKRGIIHLFSPPYTQSLNHIAERDIRVMLEMARCMMIHSGAPKNRYGRCLKFSAYILNRLPWKTGEAVSCIERYYHGQRTIADPRKHIRVFGCASWVHLSHPTGPHVDKLDAKAEMHIHVGFDPLRRCYINETLSGKIVLSAHCTFNESAFPWKKLPTYEGPVSSDFIDDDLQASMRFPHTRIPVHSMCKNARRPPNPIVLGVL